MSGALTALSPLPLMPTADKMKGTLPQTGFLSGSHYLLRPNHMPSSVFWGHSGEREQLSFFLTFIIHREENSEKEFPFDLAGLDELDQSESSQNQGLVTDQGSQAPERAWRPGAEKVPRAIIVKSKNPKSSHHTLGTTRTLNVLVHLGSSTKILQTR